MHNQVQQGEDAVSDNDLPLYKLYITIKKLDEQTGHKTVDTGSYLRLLKVFLRGYMFVSKESLLLLCEKLWIKPYHRHSSILNRDILRQKFVETLGEVNESADSPVIIEPPKALKRPKKKRPTSNDATRPAIQTPLPPSELEEQINSQQGSLSVRVSMIDDETRNTVKPQPSGEFIEKRFLINGVYLPIQSRKIEQSVRLYRERLKGQGNNVINWQETTREYCRLGYFKGLSMQETDIFITRLTVMIDSSSSMAAFSSYSDSIAAAIARTATIEDQRYEYHDLYYFNNCPDDHLYTDRLQTDSIRLGQFGQREKKSILIISDAGAARGFYNRDRVIATINFLRKLKQHRVAWINPMPRMRWFETSAEMIASYVDMFDLGEGGVDELANIVRLFKSKIRTSKT